MKVIPQFTSRPRVSRALLLRLLRGAYGALFLFSGALKLSDTATFSAALDGFMIVPPGMLSFVALAIPLLEIGIGVGLFANIKPVLVCGFATVVLGIFTGVVSEKLLEGANVSCGCFGSLSSDSISGSTLLRNAALIVWGILLTVFSSGSTRNPGRVESSVEPEKLPNVSEPQVVRDISSVWWGQGKLALSVISIVILFTLASLLAVQNHELKNRLALAIDNRVLNVGETFPAFPAWDLTGKRVEVRFPQKDSMVTVLFIFSTGCKPCSENLPQWKIVANALESFKQCQILGVSLDSLEATRQFMQKHDLSFAAIVPAIPDFSRSHKISGTPQTIVLDGSGQVKGVWVGVLDSLKNTEMLRLVHANLQGAAPG